QVIGTDRVVAQAERYGLRWDPRQAKNVAVTSLTLGVIGVHQIDLAGAYGAIANGGVLATPYLIQKITDRSGKVIYDHDADAPKPERVISAPETYLVTDILADNTDPQANPWWGPRFALPAPDGGRRPATLKTGTTNDFRDLQAFGFLAADKDPKQSQGAIVTGVWVGNSDFSPISQVFAADGPTFIWHDYMAEVAAHNKLPVRDFVRPDGIVEKQVDAISGMLPGPHTAHTVTEVFKADNVPTQKDDVHIRAGIEKASGKLWQPGCGDLRGASPGPSSSPAPQLRSLPRLPRRPKPAYSSTTVVPSPPSSRRPERVPRTLGCSARRSRIARRSAPVPAPWTIATESRPASRASSM